MASGSTPIPRVAAAALGALGLYAWMRSGWAPADSLTETPAPPNDALAGLKIMELRQRALDAEGASPNAVEDALESEDPRQALTMLLRAHGAQSGAAGPQANGAARPGAVARRRRARRRGGDGGG